MGKSRKLRNANNKLAQTKAPKSEEDKKVQAVQVLSSIITKTKFAKEWLQTALKELGQNELKIDFK